ncbi:tetratricopeptide repeat protein [Paenibacillus sp. PL2-23]|uniref:tetratricopeptide repeat protein n=1 Tax=Paenibacillus sp. PL2-23 TaxID=2100729 RepID=UPI0030F86332
MERETTDVRYARISQLMQWNRHKEAMEEAMALLREEPEDANAYAVLGQICLRLDKRDEALHWSQESLRRDPENSLAWFVRTAAYYESENWRALDEALDNAQRIDPYEPHYFFLRANACNRRTNYTEAKEMLHAGLKLSPHNALFLATLSYTEALLGNMAESRHYAKEALRQDVEHDHVYLYLGWAAEWRNDYDEQLLMLKNAIRLDPENEQIRDAYLEALQKSYKLYRILLAPTNLLKRMKRWQIVLAWIVAVLLFRPLIFVFLIVYVMTYWATKWLVHIKVFGWSRRR